MTSPNVPDALNRIADALFTQAKATREQVKVAERNVAISELMMEMQKSSMAVTKQLEKRLMGQVTEASGEMAALAAWNDKNQKPS